MIKPVLKRISEQNKIFFAFIVPLFLALSLVQLNASGVTSRRSDDKLSTGQSSGRFFLNIAEGRITLIAKDSPLGPLLQEIGNRSGVKIIISPAIRTRLVTIDWKGIPLEDGIKALAGSRGLVYKRDEKGTISLSEVHVVPSSPEGPDRVVNEVINPNLSGISDKQKKEEIQTPQKGAGYSSAEKDTSDKESINSRIVMNEMVVRFNRDLSEAEINKFLADSNITIKKYIAALNYHILSLPEGMTYYDALAYFKSKRMLYQAEPNYIIPIKALPDDPHFNMQWGLYNSGDSGVNDADIDAPEAWDFSTGGRNVVIAVIDTGVDYTHEDLSENIWRNPDEIPGNNMDDDDNGYIDDVIGWDFVDRASGNPEEDYNGPDNDPLDRHGHGTHVAGIISAVANNGIGIAGVAYNSRIMAVRAAYMDESGEGILESVDAAQAIIYAAYNGAAVINISWGDYVESTLIRDAIDIATSRGAIICASAGNDNTGSRIYPAASDNPAVIAVGATEMHDNRALFSNYGNWVHVSAPGRDIYSTKPGNRYGYLSGTSMAVPHVSGLAAMIISASPGISPLEVKSRIMNSVDVIGSLKGKNITSGRINAYSALMSGALGPCIFSVSPYRVKEGEAITISGYGFGERQTSGAARIDGYPSLNIISWENRSIVCQAPWGEISGGLYVSTPQGISKAIPVDTVINQYDEALSVNRFINGGVRQNWHGDDQSWSYTLPFAFPFFGQEYGELFISSNGFIDFTNGNASYLKSEEALAGRVMIAPLWDDLEIDPAGHPEHDIYIHMPSADSVCFRWSAKSYHTESDINVELILYRDGRIAFNYGEGNRATSPVIGISGGDRKNYLLSALNRKSQFSGADTVIFTPGDRKFTLFLKKGWNLISVPVRPENPVVPMVLGDAYNSINTIWGYFYNAWQIHIAGMFPESDFLNIKDSYGYWIKSVERPLRIRVSGEVNQGAISLNKGWNLTGYKSFEVMAVSDAISSIADKVESVWAYKNGKWYLYDPLHPEFSDLVYMEPGLGYWIKSRESCLWVR